MMPGSERAAWTHPELARLRDLRSRGLGDRAIGRLLGRTASAIAAAAQRHGIAPTRRAWTPEDEARLVALRAEGMPYTTIATILDRTPAACRIWRSKRRSRPC